MAEICLNRVQMSKKMLEILDFIAEGGHVEVSETEHNTIYKVFVGITEVFDELVIYKKFLPGQGHYSHHHREVMHLRGSQGTRRLFFGEESFSYIYLNEPLEFEVDGVFAVHTSYRLSFYSGFFIEDLSDEEALKIAAGETSGECDYRPNESIPEDYYAL